MSCSNSNQQTSTQQSFETESFDAHALQVEDSISKRTVPDNFTRHLQALTSAARKQAIRLDRRQEAREYLAEQKKRPNFDPTVKGWWNDETIRHVTRLELRENRRADRNATLDRKAQRQHKHDNAQALFGVGMDVEINGMAELIHAVNSFVAPDTLNIKLTDMEQLKEVFADVKLAAADLRGMANNPLKVEHRFGPLLGPASEALSKVRGISWKGILIDFILTVTTCYLAEWKRSVILSSLTSFVWSQRHHFPDVKTVYDLLAMCTSYLPKEREEDNAQSGEMSMFSGLLAGGCVIFAALGLGKLPGGKLTNDLFNRFSRVGACVASAKVLHDFFKETIHDVLDYFRTVWFGYDSSKMNEWKSYDSFCEDVEKLHTTDFERDVPSNVLLKNQVDSLIVRGDTILKEIEKLRIPPLQTVRFRSHYMYLNQLRTQVAHGGGGMHAPRVPAQIIQFFGSTGVGKSELTSMLNSCLLASQGFTTVEDFHRLIYYRDSSQDRFDGFISQVQGVVVDDYGSRFDSHQNPNPEPMEIIRMSNGAVWKLEMPNLSEKGNTFFSAKWVILTSNRANHKWDSLTNPEAVASRIALKFRQYPHPDFAKTTLINNEHVTNLDVDKVETALQTDPEVYTKVWLFDLVDGHNKKAEPTVLRSSLTFEQVADMCVELVDKAQDRGTRRIQGTNNMFLKYVKKYAKKTTDETPTEQQQQPIIPPKPVDHFSTDVSSNDPDTTSRDEVDGFTTPPEFVEPPQLKDNAQMMNENYEEQLERRMNRIRTGEEAGTSTTLDELTFESVKCKEQVNTRTGETVFIHAASKAEMLAKTEAVADYFFGSDGGSGGDPYRNNRGHKDYHSVHDAPQHMVSINECLPHDTTWKPTLTERITGKTHVHLRTLVDLNPDYVNKVFLKNMSELAKLGQVRAGEDNPPTNYAGILSKTCVIVPEVMIDRFAEAYATAMNVLITFTGAKGMERLYLFKQCPESSLLVFNQVMDYFLNGKSFETLKIELCPEHSNAAGFMSSVYAFLTKSHRYVQDWYDRTSMWISWIKTEVVFTAIRAVVIVLISMTITLIFKWLFGGSKPTIKKAVKNRNGNTESRQDRTKGSTTSNVEGDAESHQDRTRGAKPVNNLESFQNKQKGAPTTNVESNTESNAEAISDQNAVEIQRKLMANMYGIMNMDTQVPLGSLLFISGRVAIINRHVAMALRGVVRIQNSNESFEMDISNIGVSHVPETSKHFDKDVVLLEMPRHVRLHGNVMQYFMTRADFAMHTSLRKAALVNHVDFHTVKYATLIRAVDVPFELISQGVGTQIREAYEYNIETVRGDCGSILVAFDKNFERKIVGMHMAAGAGIYLGVSVAIHREFLDELLKSHTLRYSESITNGQCNIPVEVSDVKPFEGNYLPLGKVEPIFQPLKTNIVPSPLHGVIAEPLTAPAQLKRFVGDDGVLVDPFVNARKKALTQSVEVDEEILHRSINHYKQIVLQNLDQEDRRILTIAQAIEGIENEPTYLPIKRNTSPGGLPSFHGWSKSGKGKRTYLDDGHGNYVVDHPLVLEKVEEMRQRMLNGLRSDTVWIDTLKDERRTLEKVALGKTRLFAAGEMAFLILFRQYFFGFASHLMKNRIVNESCVGMNVYSSEWTTLANRMRSKGKHIIAGDFTNYDGTLSATFLWALLEIVEDFYQGSDEDRLVRQMMWMDIVNSVHVSGDELYVWSHSQPSGCPITALLNSLYHSVSARYVYIVCARKYAPELVSLANFNTFVAHNNYGDDDLWNISPEIIGWFNQPTISEAYATIGMTYTDELKSGTMVSSRTLEEVQFLKRKFRLDRQQARFRCPLSIDTILEMAMWNHGTKNITEITGDTLKEAVYELSHHDRATFDEYLPRFQAATKIVPVILSTYEEYQEMELYKYAV